MDEKKRDNTTLVLTPALAPPSNTFGLYYLFEIAFAECLWQKRKIKYNQKLMFIFLGVQMLFHFLSSLSPISAHPSRIKSHWVRHTSFRFIIIFPPNFHAFHWSHLSLNEHYQFI